MGSALRSRLIEDLQIRNYSETRPQRYTIPIAIP